MSHQTGNLRARRTQKLLREALIALIEERGFDALTVGELTERAMVSRAAFYRTYRDKYDLVEQIFEEAMSSLRNAVEVIRTEHPPEVWVTFFEHIGAYDRLYRALLGRTGSPWFVRKMRESLTELVITVHAPAPGPQPTAERPVLTSSDTFVPGLVSAMLVEAITWWLEQGRPSPPREIATRCALLTSALFKEVSTWHGPSGDRSMGKVSAQRSSG
jgi:AcrR family transcriptional regulator